ncbi:MAG TPA: hypothetical protein VLN49_13390 [Gemmatimonadaceae bacterium]|nr:hypothetical protein [Gemmatimonadaceae bacterium]
MRHRSDLDTAAHPLGRAPLLGVAAKVTAIAVGTISLATAACATTRGTPGGTSFAERMLAPSGRGASNDGLARQDLAGLGNVTFDEALRRLRPEWLRPSPIGRQAAEPGLASVYVNEAYVGGLDELRLIPIGAVGVVRYLTPTAARSWFGPSCLCAGGVILVSTRGTE